MKTDLCAEDVVVRLSTPQMIVAENAVAGGVGGVGVGGVGGGGVGGAGAVRGASAAVECGRRLLLAARAGDTDTVRLLMAKGAPFTTDWLGTSPLHLAAAGDHVECVGVLLRGGVSRDARTKVERTALHVAAGAGHARTVRALLEAGAAVDARDLLRMTPLHWAAQRGHRAAARLLLRHGADPHALSKFRKTPLALAAARPDLLRLMEDAIKEREAAHSVDAIVHDGADEEPEGAGGGVAHVHRSDEARAIGSKTSRSPQDRAATRSATEPDERAAEGGAAEGAEAAGCAAALLRRHGITLLPSDDGSTVLSALQSGRTVVLSDAGKLMLKESGGGAGSGGAGVVLRATPVRAPPPGAAVKVFTLSSSARLLRLPQPRAEPPPAARAPSPRPPPQQVKLVQLAGEGQPGQAGDAARGAGDARPAVRIIMNRHNYRKLVATATRASAVQDVEAEEPGAAEGEAVVVVPEQFVRSSSAQYLRSQLLCAHAAIQHLARQLHRARAQQRD